LEQPVILEKDEIIVHSFLGDEIYVLKNPQEINSEKFQLLDEETSMILWLLTKTRTWKPC
jgi:hypothetical protein